MSAAPAAEPQSALPAAPAVVPRQVGPPAPASSQRGQKDKKPSTTSSNYRGVTKHRITGRFEAQFWDASAVNKARAPGAKTGRARGRQAYLGGYNDEITAAQVYDRCAIRFLGKSAKLNFKYEDYEADAALRDTMTREEWVAHLCSQSDAFSHGHSKFRGVTKHHHGKWEARISNMAVGKRYRYLGTFDSEELAARAYDLASIICRKQAAIVNFPITDYLDMRTGTLKPDLPWKLPADTVQALETSAAVPPEVLAAAKAARTAKAKARAEARAAAKAAAIAAELGLQPKLEDDFGGDSPEAALRGRASASPSGRGACAKRQPDRPFNGPKLKLANDGEVDYGKAKATRSHSAAARMQANALASAAQAPQASFASDAMPSSAPAFAYVKADDEAQAAHTIYGAGFPPSASAEGVAHAPAPTPSSGGAPSGAAAAWAGADGALPEGPRPASQGAAPCDPPPGVPRMPPAADADASGAVTGASTAIASEGEAAETARKQDDAPGARPQPQEPFHDYVWTCDDDYVAPEPAPLPVRRDPRDLHTGAAAAAPRYRPLVSSGIPAPHAVCNTPAKCHAPTADGFAPPPYAVKDEPLEDETCNFDHAAFDYAAMRSEDLLIGLLRAAEQGAVADADAHSSLSRERRSGRAGAARSRATRSSSDGDTDAEQAGGAPHTPASGGDKGLGVARVGVFAHRGAVAKGAVGGVRKRAADGPPAGAQHTPKRLVAMLAKATSEEEVTKILDLHRSNPNLFL